MSNAEQAKGCIGKRVGIIVKILPYSIVAVFRDAPFLLMLLLLMTVASGITPMVTVYVGKLVVNGIVNVLQHRDRFGEAVILANALGLQLIVLVSSRVIEQGSAYLSFFMGRRLSLSMNAEVIKKAMHMDYAFFESPHFYDMMTRAQRESEAKPLILVLKLTSIVAGAITFISMGGLVISFSKLLFVVMLIVSLPLLIVRLRYGEKGYSLMYGRTEDQRLAGYISNIATKREYIPEIYSFGLAGHLFDKWYTCSKKFFDQDIQLHNRRSISQSLVSMLTVTSTVGAAAYIIYTCLSRGLSLTVGDVMMYSAAFTGGLAGLRVAMEGVSGIYENALFLHNYLEFNKLRSNIETGQGRAAPEVIETIELRNVSFKYPDSDHYVLKNVSVTFNRGESILIVGANGAGKTTLIKLLARLFDPSEGRILVNGTDIREFSVESLRKRIGIIFQEFVRYAFSVKENIGCGDIDEAKIVAAAKNANAESFIEQLSKQYDTILSRLFKNGQELSLGQWQRICLARLFMKDAPVFILDEPTASLDIETEACLLGEIAQVAKKKICILVSHRMFKPNIAEKIIVLSDGRITEAGTYEKLLAKQGEFARLCKLYHSISEKSISIA